MKIKILVSGKTKEKIYLKKILNYKKWISSHSKIEILYLKDNDLKRLSENQIIYLNKINFSIALTEQGSQLNSIDFANFIQNKNVELLFIIGPPNGLSQAVIEKSDYQLSLSKFTLPHELSFLVLMEQLFREISIINGSKYHRD